jgi:hypothetical protein
MLLQMRRWLGMRDVLVLVAFEGQYDTRAYDFDELKRGDAAG